MGRKKGHPSKGDFSEKKAYQLLNTFYCKTPPMIQPLHCNLIMALSHFSWLEVLKGYNNQSY